MFVHVRAFTHIHPRPFPLFAPFSSCSEFSTGKFGCRYATTAAGCHLTNGAGWNTANCGSGGTDCKLTTLTTTAVAITGGKRRREKKSVLYYTVLYCVVCCAVCCAVCEGISAYLCVLLTRSTTCFPLLLPLLLPPSQNPPLNSAICVTVATRLIRMSMVGPQPTHRPRAKRSVKHIPVAGEAIRLL